MSKILDQYGQPIDSGMLTEPQTARIASLQNRYLEPMLAGLTPARLARTLQEADMGNLMEQHRLFSDMEERDGHLRAEIDKRKNAIVGLRWDVVAPRNASAAEKAAAEWVREMLQDAVDPIEDLLLTCGDGVGHGFGPTELEWYRDDGALLPAFHPRPQEWFRMNQARTRINLQDGTVDGAPLQPFGWVMHTHGKAKTGYGGRMGLHRTLAWPFLYKAYALGDFAEFLETYGLPFIIGKHQSGATADEKASLMRAVTALGHDARAIMPVEMAIEIAKVATGGGESSHLAMMEWADKAMSKVILGQTLSADGGKKGSGGLALGLVHEEVRRDIMRGDARQIAATITRDLIYPMVALNRPGIGGPRRCPVFTLDVGQPEDIKVYADSLPALVNVGFQIPLSWAQDRLHIPLPVKNEAVLAVKNPTSPAASARGNDGQVAALSAQLPAAPVAAPAVAVEADPNAGIVNQLASAAAPVWGQLIDDVKAAVDEATDLTALQRDLVAKFGGQPQDTMASLMAAAFALAELKALSDIQDGR